MADRTNKEAQLLDKQLRAAHKAQRALDRLTQVGAELQLPAGAEMVGTVARLTEEIRELKASYYLAGAHKKLDLRQIEPFAEIAATIVAEGRTTMQLDRLYTLWQAAIGAPEGPFLEVGSYKGGSARFIAESLRRAGRSPAFFVCDTFQGHAAIDKAFDTVHRRADKFLDTSVEEVAAYLEAYDNVRVVQGDIRTTTAALPQQAGWALVHIDVDVHPATSFCLRHFGPQLLPGAWLVVDDYGFTTCPGAKTAVDDFIREQPTYRMLHLLSGQAVITRSPIVAGA